MTFTPVFNLPPDPLIRVFFSGLLIAKPAANGSTCEVFVHRTALDHVVSIEIRLKRAGQRDVLLARIAPLEFAVLAPGAQTVDHGFLLVTTAAAGIKGYEGPDVPEGQSFRSVLDLFNLHRGKTRVLAPAARPSIFMNDGVFYAADITAAGLTIDLFRLGTFVRHLTPFASLLGANIYNPATATWRQNGVVQSLKLDPLPTGSSYEIYVINDPLFQPPVPPGQEHDELQEYYKILPDVPQGEQFNLVFVQVPPGNALTRKTDDRGSTRTPCMSVVDDS